MSFPDEKPLESQTLPPPVRMEALKATPFKHGQAWLARNTLPLAVIFLCFISFGNAVVLRRAFHGTTKLVSPPPSEKAPNLEELPEKKLLKAPAMLARTALGNLSIFLCIGLGLACVVSAHYRKRFAHYFAPTPSRILPAVRGIDIVAAFAVTLTQGVLLAYALVPNGNLSAGEHSALVLLCGTGGMLIAVAVLVLLTVWRAGGLHGAAGLFPFWKLARSAPARMILGDVTLALGIFVLTNGPLLLSGALNKWLVKILGMKADQHSLIGELLVPQPQWVLAVFLIAATFGAAFTEEIIFRGGVYNACRRYLNRWESAILAALLFSAIHFIRSDFIPLFLMGLIMTWLYERTGRLVASMVFHFTNNLVSILSILALKDYIN